MRLNNTLAVGVAAIVMGTCGLVAADAAANPARIAFAGDGSILTINADGTGRRQLTVGNRYYQGVT